VTLQTLAKPLPAPARLDPAPPPIARAAASGDRARPAVRLLSRGLDRLFARWSLVPDDPVIDVRLFPWTAELRANWRTIRDEALEVAPRVGRWRAFRLWDAGQRIDANALRCPATAALVARIPGVESAHVSIMAPGVHFTDRRGDTKALITCHLGLIVPRDGDIRMRVGARTVRWAEGETLVFDETRPHAAWNDASAPRAVLLIRFARPMRGPGAWLAGLLLRTLRRSGRERKGFPSRA
jgi:aspartyl/asparaginyl beta-hydroxylase (cupin superfamily)